MRMAHTTTAMRPMVAPATVPGSCLARPRLSLVGLDGGSRIPRRPRHGPGASRTTEAAAERVGREPGEPASHVAVGEGRRSANQEPARRGTSRSAAERASGPVMASMTDWAYRPYLDR
jgi:hypothetical protein